MSLPHLPGGSPPFLSVLWVGLFLISMQSHSSAQRDPLHIWVGKPDRAAAEKWVGEHLAQEQKYVDELLAVKGPRTIENCASSPASGRGDCEKCEQWLRTRAETDQTWQPSYGRLDSGLRSDVVEFKGGRNCDEGQIQAMRGISHIAAVTLVSEIGDFQRFGHPRQLVSYVGLSPSEHSSVEKTIRGSITKAGTERGRRVLIEGAWTYRMPARVGNHIAKRHHTLTNEVLDIAWKAQVRLCQRYRSMTARGKNKNVTITAIAREMVCFIWAIARTVQLPSPAMALVS
jgi:hypothetical protein